MPRACAAASASRSAWMRTRLKSRPNPCSNVRRVSAASDRPAPESPAATIDPTSLDASLAPLDPGCSESARAGAAGAAPRRPASRANALAARSAARSSTSPARPNRRAGFASGRRTAGDPPIHVPGRLMPSPASPPRRAALALRRFAMRGVQQMRHADRRAGLGGEERRVERDVADAAAGDVQPREPARSRARASASPAGRRGARSPRAAPHPGTGSARRSAGGAGTRESSAAFWLVVRIARPR